MPEFSLRAGRPSEQLLGQCRAELVGREVVGEARTLLAALEVRPVAADADDDVRAGDRDRVHLAGVDALEVVGDERVEARVAVAEVEAPEPGDALLRAGCDAVEVVLQPGREVVVDELVEVPLQQLGDRERDERRDERRALLVDVAAVEDRPHDRGVRRGSADASLLERLDEARFRVPRGRARLVPLRLEARRLQRLADRQRGKPSFLVILAGLVTPGLVGLEEPGERDHRAARAEGRRSVVGRFGAELDRDGLAGRVLHLRGDRPLEDEVVERVLVP